MINYKISLQKIQLDNHDYSLVLKWLTDQEVMKFMGFYSKVKNFQSENEAKDFCKKLKEAIFFGIYCDDKLIGQTTLSEINDDSCKYGILIGEKEYWGRGIGTKVTKMMINYAFKEMGVKQVVLETAAKNIAGQKAYEKAGFHIDKILKNERVIFINGQEETDGTIVMSINK